MRHVVLFEIFSVIVVIPGIILKKFKRCVIIYYSKYFVVIVTIPVIILEIYKKVCNNLSFK